ncbi:MAG TPA: cobalamin-independent methionine synthase II family protein [Solirubrobacteraceae bacterium]|jgi:5-methyltetrahydropteroyltriglutamate--homocysteine methyltransferase
MSEEPTIRADNLGSFLRPPYLLQARAAQLPAAELRAVEDRAIEEVLAFQEAIGLRVLTDGEFRRRHFFSTLDDVVEGLEPEGFVRHHRDEHGNLAEVRTPTPVARLQRTGYLADVELDFVKARTAREVKVTMPAPSLLSVYWSEELSPGAYATRELYREHLVELMHEDAVELARRGAAHIQLDAPHYAYLQEVLKDTADRDAELRELVEADNGVLRGIEGITSGLHVCRGNMRSRFTGTEPYDGFAHSILPFAEYDRVLLEYDDERSGGFGPLRHLREDAIAVLGLVTTKRGTMESAQELSARVEEAAQHVPLSRLALSTQCGFASNALGNEIDVAAQSAKMELVIEVATSIWGSA